MKFKKATTEDLSFLFNLRNEPENVKYSKRGKLRLDEVENDYLLNPNKKVYIAEKNEKPVGYLIFEYLDKNVFEISVAISVEQRGRGFGKLLVKEGTAFGTNELQAEKIVAKIFPKNISSLKIFQDCSYKLINNDSEPWQLIFLNKGIEKGLIFIFDFDGVIADSVSSLYDVYLGFLEEFEITGNQEEFNLLNGPKLSEIISFLKKKYHLKKDEKELLEIYQNKISSIYNNIRLNEGIENILEWLKKKNIKIALASSSKKEEILSVLKRYDIEQYFDFIITGDDIKEAKPSPEIYNTVRTKYPNCEFYVIEDSENGLKSANSAGLKTIFYNPNNNQINLETTYTIHSLSQIKKVITEIELNCFTVAKANNISLTAIEYEPEINSIQRDAIEKLWNDELKKRKLFNGNIVSYRSHENNHGALNIKCFITQYKYFFAQLRNPELNLNITPIGVSGIIIDEENNTLLAVRQNVTEYNGYYELIPAGSIDSSKREGSNILFQNQLITEFEEETRISKDVVKEIQPFCLIFDKNHGVYDICSKIHIYGSLKNKLNTEQNEEYRNIEKMNLKNLLSNIEHNKYVPTSITILNNIDE